MRTISWREGKITLLDQTALPHTVQELEIVHYRDLIDAIKRLAVRGAPALGVAGAYGVALILHNAAKENWSMERIDSAIAELREARPTAVNLAWGVDQMKSIVPQGFAKVLARAEEIASEDAIANRAMGKHGADFLMNKCGERKLRILTHCNTGALATTEWGTALGVVRELANRGYIEEVLADETRPLLQGARLTAWELSEAKIPYRLLPDGAAASALFAGLVDAVVIGADRITRNGDTANKIGSLGVAVAASQVKVPFLVVAPESTIDRSLETGAEIEIEFRSDAEVTHFGGVSTAPVGTRTYNPAFDVTPVRYISAIVTEKRVYEMGNGTTL
ncbi:MAG: S-methyl-5-thioribose-1-phosphate isomerase [Actinobacteria bacterium]|nr:S-methyl-5-thioribose-1-phosphate isomerase [Actinomycetota bacterium]NDC51695.1 S-methyl-5-thioribose-1-phosphate isomerase [Actinomycetota bacterium]